MAKLKLTPDPTFKAKVGIPVAGGGIDQVEFVFKHRTRDELDAFLRRANELRDAALILEVASGWELADGFTEENLTKLVQNYIGSPKAIFEKYLDELTRAREKN